MMRWLRFILGIVLGLALLWGVGFIWFAATLPDGATAPDTRTDGIVVLTGGTDRVETGLRLLGAGRAQKLFISGVYPGVDVAQLLRVSRLPAGQMECCIVLGYVADTTKGNARETANWMRQNGYRSVRIVTASYHMPRSLLEFRNVMPEAVLVPHPVLPPQFHQDEWWRWPGTASLIAIEFSKFLLAAARAAAA
jgi:uncharacterized SAM-binding protein YcdF (DUF218 family)